MSNQNGSPAPNQTLADLATTMAGASRVFSRHRIDYCCGGTRTLEEACLEKGLDWVELLDQIIEEKAPDEAGMRWDERETGTLIDHLLERYHLRHRGELPRLLEMARKVEAVHADRSDRPAGLHAHLTGFAERLGAHMDDEERTLFPMLLGGGGAAARERIQGIEAEHQEAASDLLRTRALTSDLTPPQDACGTWKALYLGLEEFEAELMHHVHLENHVLFPRAATN